MTRHESSRHRRRRVTNREVSRALPTTRGLLRDPDRAARLPALFTIRPFAKVFTMQIDTVNTVTTTANTPSLVSTHSPSRAGAAGVLTSAPARAPLP